MVGGLKRVRVDREGILLGDFDLNFLYFFFGYNLNSLYILGDLDDTTKVNRKLRSNRLSNLKGLLNNHLLILTLIRVFNPVTSRFELFELV